MNNPVVSEIYKITDCIEDLLYTDIPSLIKQLGNSDGFIRSQARQVFCCIGASAIPELIKTVSIANPQLRWEVIKVLECLQDPTAIPTLVEQLEDDHAGTRWAASNALVGMQRRALPAIFAALVQDFDSIGLRQGAHHILHVFKDDGILSDVEEKVYEALEGIEPGASVPWAAQKALESIKNKKYSPHPWEWGYLVQFAES